MYIRGTTCHAFCIWTKPHKVYHFGTWSSDTFYISTRNRYDQYLRSGTFLFKQGHYVYQLNAFECRFILYLKTNSHNVYHFDTSSSDTFCIWSRTHNVYHFDTPNSDTFCVWTWTHNVYHLDTSILEYSVFELQPMSTTWKPWVVIHFVFELELIMSTIWIPTPWNILYLNYISCLLLGYPQDVIHFVFDHTVYHLDTYTFETFWVFN